MAAMSNIYTLERKNNCDLKTVKQLTKLYSITLPVRVCSAEKVFCPFFSFFFCVVKI